MLYQYTCENKKCEKSSLVMEFLVPLKQYDAVIGCPKCQKALKKLLSSPRFIVR